MKDDRLVDPVQELGGEVPPELLQYELLDLLRVLDLLGAAESHPRPVDEVFGPDVRGHDDQRVLEVDEVPVGVGQDAVLQDLEEQVGDVGMSLLDLVEQDDAVRVAPDPLGECPQSSWQK